MPPTEPAPAGLLADAVGTWTLDPAATTVSLETKAMWGLAKVKGTFAATEGAGQVAEDGTVTGRLVVDAASVDTGNARRDTHLRSGDFLEVEAHPQFVYEVSGVRPAAGGALGVDGSLTIHGQTRPVALTATVEKAAPDRVTVAATTDIDRSAFGIDWTKMGAKVDNHIVVHAEFTRA